MNTRYILWFVFHVRLYAPLGSDNTHNYCNRGQNGIPTYWCFHLTNRKCKCFGRLIKEKRHRYLFEQIFLKKFQHAEHNTTKWLIDVCLVLASHIFLYPNLARTFHYCIMKRATKCSAVLSGVYTGKRSVIMQSAAYHQTAVVFVTMITSLKPEQFCVRFALTAVHRINTK